jgi:hypothetical protein
LNLRDSCEEHCVVTTSTKTEKQCGINLSEAQDQQNGHILVVWISLLLGKDSACILKEGGRHVSNFSENWEPEWFLAGSHSSTQDSRSSKTTCVARGHFFSRVKVPKGYCVFESTVHRFEDSSMALEAAVQRIHGISDRIATINNDETLVYSRSGGSEQSERFVPYAGHSLFYFCPSFESRLAFAVLCVQCAGHSPTSKCIKGGGSNVVHIEGGCPPFGG